MVSLKWQREDYQLGDDSGLSALLMPGVSYSYLKSDNRIDPRNGYRLQFESKVAKEGLGSDNNLSVRHGAGEKLTTVFDKHRLLGRVQVGGSATSGFKSVPPSLRFRRWRSRACAVTTIRACPRKTPAATASAVVTWWLASAVCQYSVAEKWRVATFVDQGNAFNTLELPSLKTGVEYRRALGLAGGAARRRPGPRAGRRRRHSTALFHGA